MYVNKGSALSVKSGPYLSGSFKSKIGLRQGDILSPNLFKIYMNDLKDYLSSDLDADTPKLQSKFVNCLLYADDLVLLSLSEKGLQRNINELNKFCHDWKLDINLDKTKIMIFNKAGRALKANLNIKGRKLAVVKEYKYLGLMFACSGKFNVAKKDLLQRGYKAMFKLTSMFKGTSPKYYTYMHLFDQIVKPVLLYGSEVWGDWYFRNMDSIYNSLKVDVLELCHLKFCRFVLGVNRKAPNIGVYGDTGRFPITLSAAISFTKYWNRVANIDTQSNNLLHCAYMETMQQNAKGSWFLNVKNMLQLISEKLDLYQQNHMVYTSKLKMALKQLYKKGWKEELFCDTRKGNFGNKLRTYRTYKSDFRTEEYLWKCYNTAHRKAIARFRLSAHKLNIESLRYARPRIEPQDRLCTNCNINECEDELHFMITCSCYDDIRSIFFQEISAKYEPFTALSNTDKFTWLCSNIDEYIIKVIGDFLHKCFERRK
jgi:hypothetical protein